MLQWDGAGNGSLILHGFGTGNKWEKKNFACGVWGWRSWGNVQEEPELGLFSVLLLGAEQEQLLLLPWSIPAQQGLESSWDSANETPFLNDPSSARNWV